MRNKLTPWAPTVLSITRAISGLIFMAHGTQKVLGFPAGEHAPAIFTMSWTAGLIELICGSLIAIGFLTRPAAFLASGLMAFAYWIAHAPRDFYPVNNGGDAAILYCFLFLYFVFAGPGSLSIDAMRRRA